MKDTKAIYEADNELMKSASLYADEKLAEVLAEHKKRKIKLIKISGMMIIISIIMIFATRSWFTMSKEVEGTGANMTAEGMPFEIMVSGSTSQKSMFSFVKDGNNALIYQEGTAYGDSGTKYITAADNEHMRIQWAGGSNEELEPGKSGELIFYLVPTGDETATRLKTRIQNQNIFNMKLKGFRTVETNGTVSGLTDMSTLSIFENSLSYLNGHILFFKDYYPSTDKYSGLIDTTENFSLNDMKCSIENNMIKVTLYWKWPTTFPKMIGVHSDENSIAYDSDTTTDIIRYVILHTERVLVDKSSSEISEDETINESLLLSKTNANINDLSKLYNKADSKIGSDVQYVLFVLNAHANQQG